MDASHTLQPSVAKETTPLSSILLIERRLNHDTNGGAVHWGIFKMQYVIY